MADPRYIAQVVLDRDGALPEDRIINVMHFEGDDQAPTPDRERWDELAPGLASRLVTFYQSRGPIMAATLAGTGTIKLYDFSDPKPRIPRFEQSFTFVPATTAFPGEVALVISFEGASEPGVNMRRRRGRIYLGPLATGAASGTYTADVRPLASRMNETVSSFVTMATGSNGAARLAIFSPTTLSGGGSVDQAWTDAVAVWVDDAFDTQRRRGARATTRSLGTIPA